MTVEEFSAKVDWEGGLYEAVTSYGLKSSDLNDDAPAALVGLLQNFEKKAKQAAALEDEILEYLDLE